MNDQLRKIFASRPKKRLTDKNLKAAAVLVPLFHDGSQYRLLLTKRSSEVLYHKGQISFPGGKPAKVDTDLLDTALRESWEEIGLQPKDVEIIGELDDTRTKNTGFLISPFVALIPYPYKFTRNPHELDEIIDLPLSAFRDEPQYRHGLEKDEDESTTTLTYECEGRIIWGATAIIIKQLMDTLKSTGGAQKQ